MADTSKFTIICPCCEANLTIDAQTGAILSHEEKAKPLASFDEMVKGLGKQKQVRDQIFAQERGFRNFRLERWRNWTRIVAIHQHEKSDAQLHRFFQAPTSIITVGSVHAGKFDSCLTLSYTVCIIPESLMAFWPQLPRGAGFYCL